MPYIQMSISEKQDETRIASLKSMLGEKISLLPGKSEAVLMLQFDDANTMYFAGELGKCAMIQVHLYKENPPEAKSQFASEMLKSFSEITGIPIDRIFLNFFEHSGWATRGVLK